MRRLKIHFGALILLLTLLWWLADPGALLNTSGFFPWRGLAVQYLGLLAFGLMSAAMILAVRPAWLECRLGGLDKMYRLHKWLGLGGLGLAVAHWLAAQGPKWLVQAGVLTRPVRGAAREQSSAILQFFQSQRGQAEAIGEWAFYAVIAIIAVALIKSFSYKAFFRMHRLVSVAYLVLVAHSVVLVRFDYWASPLSLAVTGLAFGGTVSAILAVTGKIGNGRKSNGRVEEVNKRPEAGLVEIVLTVDEKWPGHLSGQFAFVTFHAKEGAHPYTITSNWCNDGRLTFLIKGLGDYTNTLAETVKTGDRAIVEGPYGCFNFEGRSARQIWVGGGIGVTPFLARMRELAQHSDGCEVDFYHTTAAVEEETFRRLQAEAEAAGIRLHILVDSRDGFLSGERLRREIPDWQAADIWFCGPAKFGQVLCKDLTAHGCPEERFHQELFEMR